MRKATLAATESTPMLEYPLSSDEKESDPVREGGRTTEWEEEHVAGVQVFSAVRSDGCGDEFDE